MSSHEGSRKGRARRRTSTPLRPGEIRSRSPGGTAYSGTPSEHLEKYRALEEDSHQSRHSRSSKRRDSLRNPSSSRDSSRSWSPSRNRSPSGERNEATSSKPRVKVEVDEENQINEDNRLGAGLPRYNKMDGFYIAPAFMDKLVVHITKNRMTLPNVKVPLILGIWGGKGQGKFFQCKLVFAKMGIKPIMISAGELESGKADEPAKLIRQRYGEAADIIKKGEMCCLFINDIDAGASRLGGTPQYTVNNQKMLTTLMHIADNPTAVQLPSKYYKEKNLRVPIIITGNDFPALYAPLIRDGHMDKFHWAPSREDRIGVCKGIFSPDNVPDEDIVKIVDKFAGQSIGFFGAIRARVYDDEVSRWISGVGVENVGKKLVDSKEGPPTLKLPKITLKKLLEYGNMLLKEQKNAKSPVT